MLLNRIAAATLIALAFVFLAAPGPATAHDDGCYFRDCHDHYVGRSYWNHNGSVMYLEVNGNQREFYYDRPRRGMAEEGVEPGTLLFSGTVTADTYYGTAYLFSARCGTRSYEVSGPIQEDGARVVMTGAALSLDRNCEPRKVIRDKLVFEYLYRD